MEPTLQCFCSAYSLDDTLLFFTLAHIQTQWTRWTASIDLTNCPNWHINLWCLLLNVCVMIKWDETYENHFVHFDNDLNQMFKSSSTSKVKMSWFRIESTITFEEGIGIVLQLQNRAMGFNLIWRYQQIVKIDLPLRRILIVNDRPSNSYHLLTSNMEMV